MSGLLVYFMMLFILLKMSKLPSVKVDIAECDVVVIMVGRKFGTLSCCCPKKFGALIPKCELGLHVSENLEERSETGHTFFHTGEAVLRWRMLMMQTRDMLSE